MQQANILIVEDEALVAEDLKAHIIDMGYKISGITASGEDALTFLEGSLPDLVMMDIVLQGELDGIDVAEVIKERYHIPVIFLTAYTDKEKLDRARLTEPYGYLVKPFDERELQTTIGMALYKAESDRRLRENQRWSQAVLTSIADAVITTDKNAKVSYLNTTAEELTGRTNETAIGHSLDEVMPLPNDQQQINDLYTTIQQKGVTNIPQQTINAEFQIQSGKNIPIEISVGNIRYNDDELDGLVIAFRDVTLQRQAQKQLEQSNEELERRVQERTFDLQQSNIKLKLATKQAVEANEAKDRFLTNMSHEFRTPLNTIVGYSQIWDLDKTLATEKLEQAKVIYSSGMMLLSLIDDLMEIANSESTEQNLESVPFNISELMELLVNSHSDLATNRGLELISHLSETCPSILKGDPRRINNILKRLLDNAIRFTPSGKVELEIECGAIDDGHILTRFTVTDTGIGITDKSRIFEPLTQLDDNTSRLYDGTGLGLTIVRQLVKSMGGQIHVEDNPAGEGSLFWFELTLPTLEK